VPAPFAGSYIYPSPATGNSAGIVYRMTGSGSVKIRVYNEAGDLVGTADENNAAGLQTTRINTAGMAPGVYFYLLGINYDSGMSENQGLKKFVVIH
jgi:hypothetical protein